AKPPILMVRVESYVTLRTSAKSLTVYPLDGAGQRLRAPGAEDVVPGVGAVVRDSDRVTFRTEWLLPATAGDHARSEFGLADSRGWRQGFSRTRRLFWGPCVTGGSARLLPIFADIAACSLARPQRQLQRRSLEQVLTTPRSRPIAGPATRCVCSSKAG